MDLDWRVMFKLLFLGIFVLSSQAAFAKLDKRKFFSATDKLAATMGLSLSERQFDRDILGEYGCRVRAEIRRTTGDKIDEIVISIKNTEFILHDYYTTLLDDSSSNTQVSLLTGYTYSFPDTEYHAITVEKANGKARLTIKQGGRKEVCGGLKLNLDAVL